MNGGAVSKLANSRLVLTVSGAAQATVSQAINLHTQ